MTSLGQPGKREIIKCTKSDVHELAFDNLDNVADLRICEHLQIVRQLVGQACGAKGAGARSLNLPVNSKWKTRNICTNLALTAPYTCHLHLQKSGLRSRQRFQELQDLSPGKRLHDETFC